MTNYKMQLALHYKLTYLQTIYLTFFFVDEC